MVKGISVSPEEFEKQKGGVCKPCVMGKHQRRPHPKKAAPRDTKPGETLNMDVCESMEEESYGGARYFASFIDDASSDAEVTQTGAGWRSSQAKHSPGRCEVMAAVKVNIPKSYTEAMESPQAEEWYSNG
jgi:hypothetical protein